MFASRWFLMGPLLLVLCGGMFACEAEPEIEGVSADVPDVYSREVLASPQRVMAAAYDVMAANPYMGMRVMGMGEAFEPTGSAVTRSPGGIALPIGDPQVAGVREVITVAEPAVTVLVQPLTDEVSRITVRRMGGPNSADTLTVMDMILDRLQVRAQGVSSSRIPRERNNMWGSEPSELRVTPDGGYGTFGQGQYAPDYGIPGEEQGILQEQGIAPEQRQRLNGNLRTRPMLPSPPRVPAPPTFPETDEQVQLELRDSPPTGEVILPQDQPGAGTGQSTQSEAETQTQPGRSGPVRQGQPELREQFEDEQQPVEDAAPVEDTAD